MTTANLMNVSSVNGFRAQVDASKKLQEENLEVAEVFAGYMNQTVGISNAVADDSVSNMDISKTSSTQTPAESYERYSYKEKTIDTAKESSVSEQFDDAEETLTQASEEIVDTICEEYGVDEETAQKLLESMGLQALDLLNPQNLASFIAALTGVESGELLLDANFLHVMETMNQLADGLMNSFGVDMEGLQELIAQMELADMETGFDENLEAMLEQVSVENNTDETDALIQDAAQADETAQISDAQTAEGDAEVQEAAKNMAENPEDAKQLEASDEKNQTDALNADAQESEMGWSHNSNKESAFSDGRNAFQNTQTNENIIVNQTNANVNAVNDFSQMQFNSYLSADTVQIMEQVVQQMRVNISNEMTSMEMQLNPENLGKVYVNISTEEGVVNAQFHATNEVVKEALEAQIATLRENLNQAGVKVDAIEVTIASHEFERNLEQNHQNPEEQVETQEEKTTRRRNLTVDSLDELSGVMTEEESLVAQMMKDNGNTVDFTA